MIYGMGVLELTYMNMLTNTRSLLSHAHVCKYRLAANAGTPHNYAYACACKCARVKGHAHSFTHTRTKRCSHAGVRTYKDVPARFDSASTQAMAIGACGALRTGGSLFLNLASDLESVEASQYPYMCGNLGESHRRYLYVCGVPWGDSGIL